MEYKFKNTSQNLFIHYANVFDYQTLKKIESISKLKTPVDDVGGDKELIVNNTINTRKVVNLNPQDNLPSEFFPTLIQSLSESNKTFNFNYKNIILHYSEYGYNKSWLNWHMDIGEGEANQRKLSFSINVNDPNEYEGGNLEFNLSRSNGQFDLAPQIKGGITIWPSFLLHRLTTINKGVRKVIIGFALGEPYK